MGTKRRKILHRMLGKWTLYRVFNQVQMYKLKAFKVLKGHCHEICSCFFLHQIAPPGPIRGTLAGFRVLPNIHRYIRIWNRLRSVKYTAESITRTTLLQILRSYSSCYMIKLCITLLVFLRIVSLRAVVDFICLAMASPVYLTLQNFFKNL